VGASGGRDSRCSWYAARGHATNLNRRLTLTPRRAAREVELAALEAEFAAEYDSICAEEAARAALAEELAPPHSGGGGDGDVREARASQGGGPAVVAVAADGTQSSGLLGGTG
jgi:hypothetical protein